MLFVAIIIGLWISNQPIQQDQCENCGKPANFVVIEDGDFCVVDEHGKAAANTGKSNGTNGTPDECNIVDK